MWIRHVIVPGLTDDDKYLYELGYFIGQFHNLRALDALPYHDMGKKKYEELGIEYRLKDTKPLDPKVLLEKKKSSGTPSPLKSLIPQDEVLNVFSNHSMSSLLLLRTFLYSPKAEIPFGSAVPSDSDGSVSEGSVSGGIVSAGVGVGLGSAGVVSEGSVSLVGSGSPDRPAIS